LAVAHDTWGWYSRNSSSLVERVRSAVSPRWRASLLDFMSAEKK
jgi:hypothetical protein